MEENRSRLEEKSSPVALDLHKHLEPRFISSHCQLSLTRVKTNTIWHTDSRGDACRPVQLLSIPTQSEVIQKDLSGLTSRTLHSSSCFFCWLRPSVAVWVWWCLVILLSNEPIFHVYARGWCSSRSVTASMQWVAYVLQYWERVKCCIMYNWWLVLHLQANISCTMRSEGCPWSPIYWIIDLFSFKWSLCFCCFMKAQVWGHRIRSANKESKEKKVPLCFWLINAF